MQWLQKIAKLVTKRFRPLSGKGLSNSRDEIAEYLFDFGFRPLSGKGLSNCFRASASVVVQKAVFAPCRGKVFQIFNEIVE